MNTLQTLAAHLSAHGQTVSCAESCTGGLLAAEFTSLPGSSLWFRQSWVVYSNEAKRQMLGVSPQTLDACGAVSGETAGEMAAGAAALSGADYVLAVSGIAGPGGGTAEKPVGTVWFGLAAAGRVESRRALFRGTRAEIRRQAVDFALAWLADNLHPSAESVSGG